MKVVLGLIALVMVAAVNAMPSVFYGNASYTGVEQNQVNARIILLANEDLAVVESQLENFSAESAAIATAADVMTTAMNKTGYAEASAYIHTSTPSVPTPSA